MKKIKNITEIPESFNIKKYEPALHFTAQEWYNNLLYRKTLTEKYATMGIPEEFYEHYDPRVRYEEAAISIDRLLASPILIEGHFPSSGIKKFKSKSHNLNVVYSLSKYHAYNLYLDKPEWQQQETKKDMTTTFTEDDELDHFLSNYEKPAHENNIVFNTDRHREHYPVGYEKHQNIGYACVNFEASNDVIIEHFKTWLKNEKQKYFGCYKAKQFTRSNFLSWYNASVLQYIDLTIWAITNDVTIPHHIMGEAIFPDNSEINVAEAVRKTTKPTANMLMSTGLTILKKQQYSDIPQ